MKFGIYTNVHKDKSLKATKALFEILKKKNIPYCFAANEEIKDVDQISLTDLSNDADIIIAFGGDGTMLNVISYIDDKPVSSIPKKPIPFPVFDIP